jgi:hypothetical protein
MKNRKFLIPNTVICYWVGDVGIAGRLWVDWGASFSYLRDLGFHADMHYHRKGSHLALQAMVVNDTWSRKLHGLYFWGHGSEPFPADRLMSRSSGSGGSEPSWDDVLEFASTGAALSRTYKLALGLIFACDSNSGKAALSSAPAPGSIWHGYTGILVPLFPPYHVNQYISPGDQETKKAP